MLNFKNFYLDFEMENNKSYFGSVASSKFRSMIKNILFLTVPALFIRVSLNEICEKASAI